MNPPLTQSSGVLTIDLAALADNWRRLAARGPAACAAVIKADAYGIGIEAAAPALHAAGCRVFFVAQVERRRARARRARPAAGRAYTCSTACRRRADPAADYAAHDLAPVIGSPRNSRDGRWQADGRRPARFTSTPA